MVKSMWAYFVLSMPAWRRSTNASTSTWAPSSIGLGSSVASLGLEPSVAVEGVAVVAR